MRAEQEAIGNFLEADRANQRIIAIRKQQMDKRGEILGTKQENERATLDARQAEEFKAFNDEWERKMTEFKEVNTSQEEELLARHTAQYEEHRKKLEDEIPTIPKHAADYLNNKRIQESLVKQRNYQEAHKMQQHMMELEQEEQTHWGDARKSKIQQVLRTLQAQQEAEMNSLKKRVKTGTDELKKQRAIEMERLLKRFQNLKKELANYQRIEQNKLEGKHSMGTTVDLKSTRSIFMASPTKPTSEDA